MQTDPGEPFDAILPDFLQCDLNPPHWSLGIIRVSGRQDQRSEVPTFDAQRSGGTDQYRRDGIVVSAGSTVTSTKEVQKSHYGSK